MADPLVILVTANETASRCHNRHVPWTAAELANDAARCRDAGAAIVHFHGRTSDGGTHHDACLYREAIAAIRARSDILQLPSMANTPGASASQRLGNLHLGMQQAAARPDFLAIEPGCVNMDLYEPKKRCMQSNDRIFVNSFETVEYFLDALRAAQIVPLFASFNVSWTRAFTALLDMGKAPAPALLQLVHGGPSFISAHPATPQGLDAHLAFLPAQHQVHWLVSSHQASVLELAELAIDRGGHVAIGLGDHPYTELGEPTNADLVACVVALGRRQGREPATPGDVRRMLPSMP